MFFDSGNSHLNSKARPRSKAFHPQLNGQVSWFAPCESIIQALHHHGAGGAALVTVEAQRVDEYHSTCLLIHNN